MKSKRKKLVKTTSLVSLINAKDDQILSEKQMGLIIGGNITETTTIAATIRAANSL
jgi:hypothetical protein